MRPLTIKVPTQLEQEIDRMAKSRGVPRSVVVREALEAYVAPPGASVLDPIRDLVGAFDGLPPDLSTNPKYLDGFGDARPPRRRANRRPS
jgi:hypothetical protein